MPSDINYLNILPWVNILTPFTDWGFKRLFGQEFSKDLLISFLNDLLVDEMHIRDVTFKDKEQLLSIVFMG